MSSNLSPGRSRLVLASGSPRRREILESLGLRFMVRKVDIDESLRPYEEPGDYVLRLAETKAGARCDRGEVVLGADTIVVLDGQILGKPTDPEDARRMLERLEGRQHEVLTGVAVAVGVGAGALESIVSRTEVQMGPLTSEEIEWYISTGEGADKAGAYAIQGIGSMFVEENRGNYSNVVGLPVPHVFRLFKRLGLEPRQFMS